MYRVSQELLRNKSFWRKLKGTVWGVVGACLLLMVCPRPALWAGSWQLVTSIEKGKEGVPLHYPLGINYDASLNRLYVADAGNDRLISYTMDWKPLKIFDAAGQLKGPIGMVREKDGSLWIVERPINSLTFINLKQRKVERHHLTLKGRPVLVDKITLWKDRLVILDRATGKILILRKDLTAEKEFVPETKDFKGFFDIKVKGDVLWGMETLTGRLFGFSDTGKVVESFVPKRHLPQPVSFDRDAEGNVYILDRYLKKLLIFNRDGSLRYEMLKKGFKPGQLSYPWQVLIVGQSLLVLDEGNGRIDVWNR